MMDSSVVQSQVHENDEHYPNDVVSQQEDHQFDQEKKSVMIMNKVKAKAKKIKDTIKKHGHQVLDRGHENNNEDHHTLDDHDHDLDENEEMAEDPEVHATPIHESEVVKTAPPTSEQVKNLEKSGINFGGTKVMGEEPHHDPLVEGVSSTTEIDQSIATDPAKTLSVEEKAGLRKENLEGPIGLTEDPHTPGSRPEAYTPPNYQTKVIDPSGAVHESEVVKTATPTSEQVKNLEKSGINFGGTKVRGEEPHHDPLVEGVSSTIEIDQSIATDPAKTFSVEENAGLPKENLERPIGLKEDPHTPGSRPEAYTPPNYQTKVIDPSGAGSDETEITPVEESLARMKVNDEPKRTPESNIQPTVVDSEYPPAGSHDQFVPHLPDATQTRYPSAESHDQFSPGSRSEAYNSPNYQTKPSDPRGAGSDEIEITPVEESFARMDVHDEPKPTLEQNVQPAVTNSEYTPSESHDQFVPHLSAETQTEYPPAESHDQISQETVSTNINRNLENPTETEQTFNTIKTTVEEQPHYEANIDKVVSPKNATTSEVDVGEKGDINDKVTTNEDAQKSENTSNKSGSTAGYGKNIAQSLTQKLAPVYEKVAGVGSAVKSKVTGTNTGAGVGNEAKNEAKEQEKGVYVKDYLAEKLRPGEEDKALSEVISEALHKGKEEPVKNEHENLVSGDEKSEKVSEESSVNSPGKGVVGKLKGVVGSWFGKSEENQSSQVAGGEDLSRSANYGAEQVSQLVDENKTSPIEERVTR